MSKVMHLTAPCLVTRNNVYRAIFVPYNFEFAQTELCFKTSVFDSLIIWPANNEGEGKMEANISLYTVLIFDTEVFLAHSSKKFKTLLEFLLLQM